MKIIETVEIIRIFIAEVFIAAVIIIIPVVIRKVVIAEIAEIVSIRFRIIVIEIIIIIAVETAVPVIESPRPIFACVSIGVSFLDKIAKRIPKAPKQ